MFAHTLANRLANPCPLKIVWFINPSGERVPRVTGSLPGERVRKNFESELEAQAYINKRTRGLVTQTTPRPVITSAPERAVRQLEAALQRLPPGTDVLQATEFFVEFHRPLKPLAMADAIEAFADWLGDQRKCEENTIETRKIVLTHFARTQRVARSDQITVAAAQAWIYDDERTARTQRDRFDLLNWFCGFLVKRKHAAVNPIAELDRPVVKVDAPGVFTFDETWRLLQCALTDAEGPEMLPFFAICVLSGVRPDEVPRLNGWADIYLEAEHRLIEVNKAKGGRSRRNVPISDPLWRILTWCKAQKLAPHFFSKRKFDRIRRRAGLFARWEKDVLRHTHASHDYIVRKDVKALEQAMGNSERVLFQNYIRPVPAADGRRFDGLCLHYSAPREKSAMGSGPKPRRRKVESSGNSPSRESRK